MVEIVYASKDLIPSFRHALDEVAREEIHLEMVEAPSLGELYKFHEKHLTGNWPQYFAVDQTRVVGWADITPASSPRLNHRGFLGMGLVKTHRRQGLGRRLLQACLDHAKKMGLEKVELHVNAANSPALALYHSLGFDRIGVIHAYRKLRGRYFDCVEMEKFL